MYLQYEGLGVETHGGTVMLDKDIPDLLDMVATLKKRLELCPCWCNDCQYGYITEDGITCVNPDSEWCTEWRGTYDSCEHCEWRVEAQNG